MDINGLYEETLLGLRSKKRVRHLFSEKEFHYLKAEWGYALSRQDFKRIQKILCLIEHSKDICDLFDSLFVRTLEHLQESNSNTQLIVLALGASWKPIVDRSHKTGDRINSQFIEILRNLLSHRCPEVLEWTLRTIDQIGGQAMCLKGDIIKAKPGLERFFSKEKRVCHQIIGMLLKRWSGFEGLEGSPKPL